MRNLKRALSLALASVMLLGMMVVGTSAASFPDVDDECNVEAIAVLKAVGAMKGDDTGSFNPTGTFTRNEMAAITARLLLGEGAETYAGSCPFTDVPEWAQKYVAACYDNGIVEGTNEEGTLFSGDLAVTAQEVAVMMLRALGYENITDTGADWAKRAVAKANEIELFKGVDGSVTATLTRNDVAQLALNTLKSTCVKADVERDIVVEGVVTIPGKTTYTPIESDDEYATAINGTEKGEKTNPTVQLGEKLYDGKLKLTPADEGKDDLGRPANVWEYKGDPVYTITKKADYTVTLEKTPKSKTALTELYKKDLTLGDENITVNGASEKDQDTAYAYSDLGAGDVVEFYMNKDNAKTIDGIFVTRYELNKITDVDDDVSDDDAEDGVSCYVTFDNAGEFNDTDIPGFDPDTYVEDAYVALLYVVEEGDEDTTTIVDSYIPEIVEDSVETQKAAAGNDPAEITVGEDKYVVAVGVDAEVTPGSDNTYALYLDKNGYVLGVEAVEESAATIDDVYYLDTVWKETGKMGAESYYAQLVALDGAKKEVELEVDDHALMPADANATGENDENGDPEGAAEDNTISLGDAQSNEELKALTGMLVTISDKKVDGGTSKKGNGKYNLNLWTPTKDWEYGCVMSQVAPEGENGENPPQTIALELGKSDRNLKVNAVIGSAEAAETIYRLNSSTVYLFLEGKDTDLAVTRYVGGVSYDGEATSAFVITEKGKTLAKYVLIATEDAELAPDYTDEVIFIQEASKTKGDGYVSQTVYLPDGTKETWKIDSEEYTDDAIDPGFYSYAEGDKGIYKLDKVEAIDVGSGIDWQDKKTEGVLEGVTFTKDTDLFEGMLTVTSGDNTVDDIDVSNASFKDLHSTSDGYGKTVKDLEALADLMKGENPKVTSATLYMNISKDGAVSIFVTDVTKPAEPEPPEEGGEENEGSRAKLEITIAYKEQDGNTVIQASAMKAGDKVEISSDGQAALDLEYTLAQDGATWELTTGKSAPNGWTATFTGSKLTLEAEQVGSGKTDAFGDLTVTPTIDGKTDATAEATKGQFADGTDAD